MLAVSMASDALRTVELTYADDEIIDLGMSEGMGRL